MIVLECESRKIAGEVARAPRFVGLWVAVSPPPAPYGADVTTHNVVLGFFHADAGLQDLYRAWHLSTSTKAMVSITETGAALKAFEDTAADGQVRFAGRFDETGSAARPSEIGRYFFVENRTVVGGMDVHVGPHPVTFGAAQFSLRPGAAWLSNAPAASGDGVVADVSGGWDIVVKRLGFDL